MESVVSRSGWWLAALFLSIFAMAAAVDWGFSVHMGIFALAALIGLVVLVIVFQSLNPTFLSPGNIQAMLVAAACTGTSGDGDDAAAAHIDSAAAAS